jgi:hypothetical protein
MELFVWLHATDIVAVEQPVQLLTGQGHDVPGLFTWPVESGFLQPLLPQAKAAVFPLCPVHNYPQFAGFLSQGPQHEACVRPTISGFSEFGIALICIIAHD